MPNLSGWHFVILLLIILLLFGAPRLPKLARSLGESMRIFRGEVRNMNDDDKAAKEGYVADDASTNSQSSTQAPTTPPADTRNGPATRPGDTDSTTPNTR
jgi:sec-independent protein translocase protein TatA